MIPIYIIHIQISFAKISSVVTPFTPSEHISLELILVTHLLDVPNSIWVIHDPSLGFSRWTKLSDPDIPPIQE